MQFEIKNRPRKSTDHFFDALALETHAEKPVTVGENNNEGDKE